VDPSNEGCRSLQQQEVSTLKGTTKKAASASTFMRSSSDVLR